MDIMIIVNQLIQLFIMIAVGFILCKINFLTLEFNQYLTKFVLNVTMPCMIMASVMTSSNVALALKDILYASIIVVVLLPILAYLLVNILPMKNNKGLYMFMMMYPNVGFMGFPLMQAMFGKESLLSTAMITMVFNISLFTLGIIVMNYGSHHKTQINLKTLVSPGIISSIIAMIIYFMKLTIPVVISEPINLIGNMTTPLAMMIIGATLSTFPIKDIIIDIKPYTFTILIDLLIPIILYPVIKLLITSQMIMGVTLIIVAMPVANSAVLFAKAYHQDEFMAAKTVFISTILSIITIPILSYMFLV